MISGFEDISPNKYGQVNNFVSLASNCSAAPTDVCTGVDLAVNAHWLPRGVLVQGA